MNLACETMTQVGAKITHCVNFAHEPGIGVREPGKGRDAMAPPQLSAVSTSVRAGLHWVSSHTGIPVVVVAAVAIVVSWRLFKKSLRLVIEVAVALALLLVGTKLGWISW